MTTPDMSLVDRVMDAIEFEHDISPEARYEARAAIRAVAAWFRERDFVAVPLMLEQEADR